MLDDPYLSIQEASGLIQSRKISPRELTSALLQRINVLDKTLRAFITVIPDYALERAEAMEKEIQRGLWRGPLHGIPMALKDLIDTRSAPTTVGMPALLQHVPSRDATVVERLEAAGAIIVGKLAMTEGAFTKHHPHMPTPVNPWSSLHWTGVSSSGSGVATAAGLCFGSLASDTGGSIRFPAAACGLTGVKPTWGRVSCCGVFPLAETMDHVGPMARSAADNAIILGVIAGRDELDQTSLAAPVPDYLSLLDAGIESVRIGIDERLLEDGVSSEISDAMMVTARALEGRGAKLVATSVPASEQVIDAFGKLCACEAYLANRTNYDRHKEAYGPELAGLIEYGATITGPTIAQAHIERRRWSGALAALFADIDLLIVPVMPIPVPEITQMPAIEADHSAALARFTIPFSMSGHPALTFPGGFDTRGLPVGIQLIGCHFSEDLLLRAGHAFQQVTDWHMRHPQL